jgi:hypothetical protein
VCRCGGQFGDLRLSRLNLWAWFVVERGDFRDVTWTYEAYFTHFYVPILFTIGIFSVVPECDAVGAGGPSDAV